MEALLNPSLNSDKPAAKTTPLWEYRKLFLNHMDAWVAATCISLVALVLHDNISGQTLLLMMTMGIGYWIAFVINDFYDAPADALDERKRETNFFVKNPVTQKQLIAAVFLICAPQLLVFAQFGWRSLAVIITCIIIMWGYSAPPLRFKDRPGIDLLVHSLFVETFPYAICLFLPAAQLNLLDAVILSVIFLTSMTAQLEQQVRDYEIDLLSGTRNFATYFGRKRTVRWLKTATIIVSVIATISVLTSIVPLWLAPIPVIALPAMAHRFSRDPHAPRSEKLVNSLIVIGLIYMLAIFFFYLL